MSFEEYRREKFWWKVLRASALVSIGVSLVAVVILSALFPDGIIGRSRNGSVVAIEFTPGDSYCADLPRLAAAYKAEHDQLNGRGSMREEERALFDAALRDIGALSEACSAENRSLRMEAQSGRQLNDSLAGYLESAEYPCCGETDGVLVIGCPEASK